MKTEDAIKLALLGTAAVAIVGTVLYVNRETLFASQEDIQAHGQLLTKITLRLQSASHMAKKNLMPMTRKDIDNIVFLETALFNKEHHSKIKVYISLSDKSNKSAVKQLTLTTALTKTQAKIYCR